MASMAQKILDEEEAKWRKLARDFKFELKPFSELAIDVEKEYKVEVTVVEGIAEICGVLLETNFKYSFVSYLTLAISTYHGCQINVLKGPLSKCVVSTETSLDTLLNIHLSLEEFREIAVKNKSPMPVTLCVGGTQSGKIRAVETLFNYSLRQHPEDDRKILYVDLNHSHNLLSIPGSLGAAIVQNPLSIREGFLLNLKNPIMYCFGHTNPFNNISLFQYYVHKLSKLINLKRDQMQDLEVIINIPSWLQGSCYRLLLKTCQEFQVSHVIVFESCIAYNQLIEDMPPFVKVIHTPRIISALSPRARPRDQVDQIFEYFFGTPSRPLTPYKIDLKIEDVNVFTIENVGLKGVTKVKKSTMLKAIQESVQSIGYYSVLGVLHSSHLINREPEDYYKAVIQHYISLQRIKRHTIHIISLIPRSALVLPLNVILTDQKLTKVNSRPYITDIVDNEPDKKPDRNRERRRETDRKRRR
uniref:Polyribonucleotide 5'-hydroxyl-kinase Clp1 n=1 Tax=Cacopsylla melanoneura TaxID=428564 RepID=A0A8D8S561_9HEMI